MKVLIYFFLIFTVLSTPVFAAPPTQLDIFYGSRLFGYWTLKQEGGRLVYEDHNVAGQVKPEPLTPTAAEWSAFRETLERIGIWQWQPVYQPSRPVPDGTEWSVAIRYPDAHIASRGDNAYPDEAPNDPHMPGKNFTAFLDALRKLTGKDLH